MKKGICLFITCLVLCKTLTAQTWVSLGTGLNASSAAIATYNGELYAGGAFTTAGGVAANNIAKWNGTSWSAVGTGMNGGAGGELVVYNGELYAAGGFTTAGGIAANNIAKWNGASWSALGTGLNGGVNGSAIYNGELYISGNFSTAGGVSANRIAKWNGTTWSAVGTGMNALVFALIVFNGELYAAGAFTVVDGIPVNRVAKWNGTNWSAVGAGINSNVFALAVYNGELYAGGIFTAAGGITANRIAKWNGTEWSEVGAGISGAAVRGIFVYDGELIVGGGFTSAGGIPANNIAKWNGTSWSTMGLGMNSTVIGFAEYSGDLYCSGEFTMAGGVTANRVAKWVPPCLITTSAGADENLIFGYGPIQCKTKTAVVSNGSEPFTYNWTLDRALFPGESITGSASGTVTVCLRDTAGLSVTVTDRRNCAATDKAMIFVNDVRCFAGKNQKVNVCHNGNTICIDESAVEAHLAHGDYLGSCAETTTAKSGQFTSIEKTHSEKFNIYPNPNNGSFNVIMNLPGDNVIKTIRVMSISGQIVKEIQTLQNRIDIDIEKPGIYIMQIISNKQISTKKLIVAAH